MCHSSSRSNFNLGHSLVWTKCFMHCPKNNSTPLTLFSYSIRKLPEGCIRKVVPCTQKVILCSCLLELGVINFAALKNLGEFRNENMQYLELCASVKIQFQRCKVYFQSSFRHIISQYLSQTHFYCFSVFGKRTQNSSQ